MSDIEIKDKMKFNPTMKMINANMIEYLKVNIADSNGTVLFLNLMKMMHRSFIEENVSPNERILNAW